MFRALLQWFRNWRLRRAQAIQDAADNEFTKDASGIAAGYDIEEQALRDEYEEFISALSDVEAAIDLKRDRLHGAEGHDSEGIEDKLAEAEAVLDAALTAVKRATDANDTAAAEEAEADANEFLDEVDRLKTEKASLEADIKAEEERLKGLERQLKKFQKELANLPVEKAEALADILSNEKLAKANERLLGIGQRANERRPLDAIRRHRQQVEGRAKVTDRMVGVTTTDTKDKYLKDAKTSANKSRIKEMLEEKEAKQAEATGDAPVKATDRPKI